MPRLRIDELDIIKVKNLCALDDFIKKPKTTYRIREIYTNQMSGKSLVSRIRSKFLQLNNQKDK